jgi:UDP-glucose 4-epimerase
MRTAVIRSAYVVGGSGFIGGKLVDALVRSGDRVVVVDPLDPRVPFPDGAVQHVRTSLDADSLQALLREHPPSRVFHLGGSGSVGAAAADPAADRARTVESTRALVNRLDPTVRLVLVSSAAVYGDNPAERLEETAEVQPISVYGQHKAEAEAIALAAARSGALAVSVVRFFSVYGAGLRKQLWWDACKRLASGVLRFDGTGHEERDWLHVDDAVDLMLRAAAVQEPSLLVNGGAGIPARVAELVEGLAQALRTDGKPSFSGVGRPGDPQRLVAHIGRAQSLGWSARRSLADGIVEYARWFESLA